MILPTSIQNLIADETYELDQIGMTQSTVMIFKDKVLKIQKVNEESLNEYRMMTWLAKQLPVPRILAYEDLDSTSYLLMSRCEGDMICRDQFMQHPKMQAKLLAEGLQKLWSIDISHCPCDQSLAHKLKAAEYNIEHDLADFTIIEQNTYGTQGFDTPEQLLQWLYDNQPEEELVLSHGDHCLPNVFGLGSHLSGYIDLGRSGIADKWCDIALCYRSLSHAQQKRCQVQSLPVYDNMLLFHELGLEPNWTKINYYILLDELF